MKNSAYFILFISCTAIALAFSNLNTTSNISVSADSIIYSTSDESTLSSFNNAYDLDYVNNTLLVSEITEKKIEDLTHNTEFLLNYEPTAIANDYHETTYFAKNGLDGLCSINESVITSYNEYYNAGSPFSIRRVYDIACNIYGTTFALAYNSNDQAVILYKEKDDGNFLLYKTLNSLTLSSDSKIQISLDNNFVIFCNNGIMYKTNSETTNFEEVSNLTYLSEVVYDIPTTLNNIIDIKLDFHDSLFILTENSGVYTLYRCDKNAENYTETTNTLFENCISFALDYTNGYVYTLSNTTLSEFKITDEQNNNFIDIINTNNSPDYINNQLDITLIKTNTDNVPLYEYDNSLYTKKLNDEQITFSNSTILFSLQYYSSGYYFVLVTNLASENITGYVKASFVNEVVSFDDEMSARIVIPNTQVFEYPTSLDNALLTQVNDVPLTLSQNESIVVTYLDFGDADFNKITFAKIKLSDNTYGYIDTNSFVRTEQNTIKPTVVTNARTNENVIVYSNQSCTIELTQLSNGTDIEILEQANGIAKITWGLGTLVGYISTENLSSDQISNMQLTGLILMSTSIIIAIVLICVVASKKNKEIENE